MQLESEDSWDWMQLEAPSSSMQSQPLHSIWSHQQSRCIFTDGSGLPRTSIQMLAGLWSSEGLTELNQDG